MVTETDRETRRDAGRWVRSITCPSHPEEREGTVIWDELNFWDELPFRACLRVDLETGDYTLRTWRQVWNDPGDPENDGIAQETGSVSGSLRELFRRLSRDGSPSEESAFRAALEKGEPRRWIAACEALTEAILTIYPDTVNAVGDVEESIWLLW